MQTKVCKQCGEIKPLEQFRNYYAGRRGKYTICSTCEKINGRAKYLIRKGDKCTEKDSEELSKIYELWNIQRQAGLQPPKERNESKLSVPVYVDNMIEKLRNDMAEISALAGEDLTGVPPELAKWLTEPLSEHPDYYLDTVYESLCKTYRPILKIEAKNLDPEYDETHKGTLGKILDRFYNYEDSYHQIH